MEIGSKRKELMMKIYLDRRACSVWAAACESDFADKFLGDEVLPTACTVMLMEEDDRSELIFHIRDRDGSVKEFTVSDDNLSDAIDSWMKAYVNQHQETELINIE